LRRNLRRRELLPFFAKLPALEMALEACGGSHHWARAAGVGPPRAAAAVAIRQAVCQGGKNARNDAEAISVAAAQPSLASVPEFVMKCSNQY
jgi:transposase